MESLMEDLKIWPGSPFPLGATWDRKGVNFALFSENAEKVELCLFQGENGEREIAQIEMPEQDNQIWHVYLPGLRPGQMYSYRVHSDVGPRRPALLQPPALDPYAARLRNS
jgi:glycogen operon protein